MKRLHTIRVALVVQIAIAWAASPVRAAELTFEERVGAQEAIERVYYAHQIATTRPFEEAVPRRILEEKVRRVLRQSVALEDYWGTPVTAGMLEREVERMARGTRMAERLSELFAALRNDPLLVRECLARPALVDRLTRSFFAHDERIQGESWDAWWVSVAADFDEGRFHSAATASSASALPPLPDSCVPDDTWQNGSLDDVIEPREQATAVWTGSLMLVWGGWNGTYLGTGGRYDPATDTWSPISTVGAPSPRRSHTAVWTGTRMIVWGGYDSAVLASGGRYDPIADAWTPTSTSGAPDARLWHTAVWTGSRMIVWSGFDGTVYATTGGLYDPVTDSWLPTSIANAPSGRVYHTAVWTGSRMVIWGGVVPADTATGGRYDPVANTWEATSTVHAPPQRHQHTAVWTGTRMVVWGGVTQVGGFPPVGGRYDPVSDTWAPTATLNAPAPRSEHTAVWTGNRMVVWGGRELSETNTGARYDPVSDIWTPATVLNAPSPRSRHVAVWSGDRMLVWGGLDASDAYPLAGGRYDPVADVWTPTSTLNFPAARRSHTATWTGSLMVVWGGHVVNQGIGTGARYDPALDAWSPTSTLNAPSPRSGHTAVWTGSRVLIWGGTDYEGFGESLGSGGRYDPLTDTWSGISMQAAPSAREYHTAVWTGSRMIVWGGAFVGDEVFDVFKTGGRYDPITDTWTPTSIAGAPSQRAVHTAVWTGSRMVVWGGVGNSSGGVYEPITDTWTPTSLVSAPSKRAWHTAVWTGERMVVWGGRYDNAPLDTGGAYDPALNTWTPASTLGAPSARYQHTAVWTGSRMVVWGGTNASLPYTGVTDTGGRYDPALDAWTPTSTLDAPSARYEHTAVWTGREMIVWGGESVAKTLPTAGGRYALGSPADGDGDGFAGCQGDCNDASTAVFPGAVEACDGLDNDCDGIIGDVDEDGDGLCQPQDCIDLDPSTKLTPYEVQGVTIEKLQPTRIHFTSQDGSAGTATSYDLAMGVLSDFAQASCIGSFADSPAQDAGPEPGVGQGYYYLVRAKNGCGSASWGEGSSGSERIVTVCP